MGTVKSRLWRARAHMQRYLLDPTDEQVWVSYAEREVRVTEEDQYDNSPMA